MKTPMNPYSVMCVCKHNGKEVRRIAAAAHNASAHIEELRRRYGSLEIDYVEDETAAMISQALHGCRLVK